MIELNLLPDVKQEFVRSQRLKRIIIASMIALVVVVLGLLVLVAFYVYGIQTVRNKLADDDIAKYSEEIKKDKNLTRNLTIQNQLSTLSDAHSEKVSMDRLFDYLKILNPQEPNNMKISKADIDIETNTITLEVSTSSYLSISIIKDTFINAKLSYTDPDTGEKIKDTSLFESVDILDPSVGKTNDGRVVAGFKASLVYKPQIFDSKVTDPNVSVPNVNTTPSASRVSIFEPAANKEEVQ